MEESNVVENMIAWNQDQYSAAISSIRTKLKELGLEKLEFCITKNFDFGKDQYFQFYVNFRGLISPTLKDKLDQFSQEAEKIFGPNGPHVYLDVQTGIGEGEQFPHLNDLSMVPTKETNKTFECVPGEVVLIDFWATWCGPCQKPMQHNQEMLENNEEKWNGKARIVGVSLDDDIESVITRVEEKKWGKIEHYHAPGGFESPAASQFGIDGIPCVFLVDKKGIIRYRGHPSAVNLEDRINELIAEGDNAIPSEIKKEVEKDSNSNMVCTEEGCSIVHNKKRSALNMDVEIKLMKLFQEKHEANKHLIEKIGSVSAGLRINREFNSLGDEKYPSAIQITGICNPRDRDVILEYWGNVIQPLSDDFEFESFLNVAEIPCEIKYGTKCATCQKSLGKGISHYVCTVCQAENKQDSAFCVDCADKELTQEVLSSKDLFHQHGLLLLQEDSDRALQSLQRVLNNVSLREPDTDDTEIKNMCLCYNGGSARCDVCNECPIVNYRWACANCQYFDYCNNCFKVARDPNHEKHKEVVEKSLEIKPHDISHVFYRAHHLTSLDTLEPKPFEFPINK